MKMRSGKNLDEQNDDNRNEVQSPVNMKEEKLMNRVYYTVFISLILDLLAFTVILPLLPSLLDHYSQNDESGLYSALKNSVSSFRSFVGAPDTPRWNSVLFG
ncbi:unnamed protein product, partial [Candidula unifasciata]